MILFPELTLGANIVSPLRGSDFPHSPFRIPHSSFRIPHSSLFTLNPES